ncbi:MAG TPA: MBL fold metallo-hydrolase, partial [Lysobacter sp.]|nr:MBL fold metallo-hydrolase [Lysobacter sp.]
MLRQTAALLFALLLSLPAAALEKPTSVRLYALECGRIEFKDMSLFADGDEYASTPGKMADPCFLIVHPKGILLWDTGLGDALASKSDGETSAGLGIHTSMPATLKSQLQQLKLKPEDIGYVGLSHLHFDHTSNLQQFQQATWVISSQELAWASATPTPFGVDPSTFAGHDPAKLRGNAFDDDL